ncbi:hypothetical protein [Actinomycetospora chiangmaiensis]|uniref:hypothetical protein n=1 Tax=Actinomycetospora chiangmaiensis TaxID=402650 RepID=UPI0003A7614A|nr:hypothetical protein [Actinomycetospora chiangmaiensis]
MARPGGAGGDPEESPTRGRHRSPDAEGGAPVLAASSLVGAPRHRRARPEPGHDAEPARTGGLPVRSLARVEAAREAASRPRPGAPVPTTGRSGAAVTTPVREVAEVHRETHPEARPTAHPGARPQTRPETEDAVTDLVARPGRGALPDGPGTGSEPAVLGATVSVVALVAAVVAAAVATPGGSRTTLLGVLAVALLGTGTAALGLGRQRPRRTLAATGVVVGAAAVAASVIPLLTM